MFWKSSTSSSLLEGEHDAEASSPATNGRPRRSGPPVRSRLMLSPHCLQEYWACGKTIYHSHAKACEASVSVEVKGLYMQKHVAYTQVQQAIE